MGRADFRPRPDRDTSFGKSVPTEGIIGSDFQRAGAETSPYLLLLSIARRVAGSRLPGTKPVVAIT